MKTKIPLILLAVLIISLTGYFYWLNQPSATPETAVLKYCRIKSLKCSKQDFKVEKTDIIDPDYGNQFIVSGVKGEFNSSISFFYLKKNSGGWKVVCAGTGP